MYDLLIITGEPQLVTVSSLLVKTFIGSARIFSRNYSRGSFTLFHSFGIDAP